MIEKKQANVLVVESTNKGNKPLCEAINLRSFHTQLFKANRVKEAIQIILEKKIDGVVIENQVEDGQASELLDVINQLSVRIIPIIVLAEKSEEDKGIFLFRKGARDFLIKDPQNEYLQRISLIMDRILEEEFRYIENSRLRKNTEAVLATISEGIIGFNLAGNITFANPASALYFENPIDSLIGKSIEIFSHKIDIGFMQALQQSMEFVKSTKQMAVVGQYMLGLSTLLTSSLIEATLIPVFSELLHLEGYVLSLRDISQTKYLNNELRLKSMKDDLTGLFNRKSFMLRLGHIISYNKKPNIKCAVLFINLDGFKMMNDALGHVYGDKILLTVANRIQSVIRETDILARVGGDEFVVLLNHISQPNAAAKVAMKINQALLPVIDFHKQKCHITASIGIALYPNDSVEPDKLVQFANVAMSFVKKQGKNHFQFYKSDLNQEVARVARLSNDLRFALQNDQLELYFHPQVSSATGSFVGLESLLRWNHPEFGLISPKEFIPIAEETGFINDIGKWAMNKAFESYMIWKKQGLNNFSLSINFSVNELLRDEFISDISHCLKRYQIDPHYIQIEITESIFANNANIIIRKLLQLKKLGLLIAMDDFGTGYSCLSYLNDLPIDIIKIDRSFVKALSYRDNEKHQAIIATIIDLAKRLHLTTIAEGVETKEQAEYLMNLGCEYFQGFLFAKPMNFKDATEYMLLNNVDVNKKSQFLPIRKNTH